MLLTLIAEIAHVGGGVLEYSQVGQLLEFGCMGYNM